MNFLIDNNLSPYLAKAICALSEPHGHYVIHKVEKFSPDTPDSEWLQELIVQGDWAIISHDRFAKNSFEKEALRSSGLTTFILKKGWKNLNGWEKAWRLVKWWPKIIGQVELVSSGAFEVPATGSKLTQIKL